MTPNPGTNYGLLPVEKTRYLFDKLLLKENKKINKEKIDAKSCVAREIIFWKKYRNGKEIMGAGVIDKHIKGIMFIFKGPIKTLKRHLNQIWKRCSEDINNKKEGPMKLIYGLFYV